MALPQDGQNANGLTKVTKIPAGKELIFIDPVTNEGGLIALEDIVVQILDNLTTKTFRLNQGIMTLPAALDQLNSKIQGGSAENIYYFSAADFETGAYNAAGAKVDTTKMLRTITMHPVSVGDSVRIKKVSKNQYAAVSIFYDGSFHDLNDWTNAESVVNIDHAGELIVMIANDQNPYAGADMVPGDYVEQVLLVRA